MRVHDLMKLPPTEIDARMTERSQQGGETLYKVSVRNTSSIPAVQVWLEVIRGDQGDEVLPSFWSDNAVTLLPGEQRELTVRFRTDLLGAALPHLMVEGWNVTPREWAASDGKPLPLSMEIVSSEICRDKGSARVQFSATQHGTAGPRWTTWPVAVMAQEHVARYVRIGLRSGTTSKASLTIANVSVGKPRIAVVNVAPPVDGVK
jgi:hypothetical protein